MPPDSISPWWLPQAMPGFPYGWGNAPMPPGQIPWANPFALLPGMGREAFTQYNIDPVQRQAAPTPVQTTSFGPAPVDGSAPPLLAQPPRPAVSAPLASANNGLLASTPFDFRTTILRLMGQNV